MKQEEFFKLLDRRLSVIEDAERQDILEEYRQHIAMKIQEDHITEEEALADFGDVDSFADEILSAYHVRTDSLESDKGAEKAKSLLRGIKNRFVSGWNHIQSFFARCGKSVAHFFSNCHAAFQKAVHREKKEKILVPETEHKKDQLQTGSCFFSAMKVFWRWLIRSVKTLWRWGWNLVFGCIGFLLAGFAAFLVILFGADVMLAIQGYPLIGSVILLIGILLCAGSAAIFFFSLIRHKEKIKSGKEDVIHA